MGVEVIGDLAHVTVQEPPAIHAKTLSRGPAERFQHVGKGGRIRFCAVGSPNHHRHAAGFAFGHPANLVGEVLPGERHCLTQLATGLR